jgi:hypothetical protein
MHGLTSCDLQRFQEQNIVRLRELNCTLIILTVVTVKLFSNRCPDCRLSFRQFIIMGTRVPEYWLFPHALDKRDGIADVPPIFCAMFKQPVDRLDTLRHTGLYCRAGTTVTAV